MTSEADNIIGLYQRHGRAWAQDRGNRLVETAWLDRFRDLLPTSASILDLGCGSGEPIGRYFNPVGAVGNAAERPVPGARRGRSIRNERLRIVAMAAQAQIRPVGAGGGRPLWANESPAPPCCINRA